MNTSSDAAEQVIRIYLEGAEVALKISGVAAKNVAAAIYAISQDKTKTKGKMRLTNMIKTGKELKIFSIEKQDLKTFAKEAKRYGVLYCVLMNKLNKNPDGMVDIMVRAEDASKINRIVERFGLNTLESAKAQKQIEEKIKQNSKSELDKDIKEKSPEDLLVEDLLSKPVQKEENEISPSISKTEENSPSENSLKSKDNSEGMVKNEEKPSVRKELKDIAQEQKEKETKESKSKEEKSKKHKGKHFKEPKIVKNKERSK